MLDPVVTPTAAIWPHNCMACQSQTGPFVDTHAERRVGPNDFERVYLCASCVRLAGIALGFLEGPEHTKLLHAAEGESRTAKQLAAMTERRDKLAAELRGEKKRSASLEAKLEWNEGRVHQLEAAITEDARSRLAVVGNEAA